MPDVDGCRETRAKSCRSQRANAINQQAAAGGVAITGGFGAIQVLQRANHIEQTHRRNHAEPRNQLGPGLPQANELQPRSVPSHQAPALLPGARRHLHQPTAPGEYQPQQQGKQTGR